MRITPFLFLALVLTRASAALPFPQESSDLRPDPAAHFGTLANGLRYVILPNREPRDRVAMRLLVLSGSLQEAEGERGLAHYLEHMAFDGSAHFAPTTLVEYFQRLGMKYGADLNAETGYQRTLYKLDLPNHDPQTLAQSLLIFHDYAGGLLLEPDMVEKERPIILAEKRFRDSAIYRESIAARRFFSGDTRFVQRPPIGDEADITAATREKLLKIYNAWYRPERLVVIVVGDIDVPVVEAQLRAALSDLAPRAPAQPEPSLGQVNGGLGLRTDYYRNAEAGSAHVSLEVIHPLARQPDTAAHRREHLVRGLATIMLTQRLIQLSKEESSHFAGAQVTATDRYEFELDAAITLNCSGLNWKYGVATAEQQLRRALQYGFTPAELTETIAGVRNAYREAANTAASRSSTMLVDRMADELTNGHVFTTPADDFAQAGVVLDQVTATDCLAALRAAFDSANRALRVSGNAAIPGDAPAAIAATYLESERVAVTPPVSKTEDPFAYGDFGPPGKVAERSAVADLGVTLVRFTNGVRLNLKRTDFQPGRVLFSVRVGAGQLIEPPDLPGLSYFVDTTFIAGGLGKHSADDLRRISAGRTAVGAFRVQADALTWSYVTNPADLLYSLQVVTAYLTDPGFRPEALRLARKTTLASYAQLSHLAEGPIAMEIAPLLASGDARFGLPRRAAEQSRTIADAETWLLPQLTEGPVEIAVVGDIDVDAAIAAVARTVGTLSARDPKPAYQTERGAHFPAQSFEKDYQFSSKIPKATLLACWPTEDLWDAPRERRLQMLGAVLNDRLRLRIREKMGDTYNVTANNVSSDTYAGYGRMMVTTVVAPERTGEALAAILAVAGELQSGGVTEDELRRAKQPTLATLRDSERNNTYWLQVLKECQEHPQRLDWARSRDADVAAITAADLTALAKKYLAPDRAFRFVVRPAASP